MMGKGLIDLLCSAWLRSRMREVDIASKKWLSLRAASYCTCGLVDTALRHEGVETVMV